MRRLFKCGGGTIRTYAPNWDHQFINKLGAIGRYATPPCDNLSICFEKNSKQNCILKNFYQSVKYLN